MDRIHDVCKALFVKHCRNSTTGKAGGDCFAKIIEKYGCLGPQSTRPPLITNDEDTGTKASITIIYIIIAVTAFLANSFVCLVYARSKEIRTAKHYFIVNLAVADILIAVVAIPFFVASYFYNAPHQFCQIGHVFDVLCCGCSIVNFAVISIERFIAIRFPLRYTCIVVRKRCLFAILLIWLYSVLIAVLAYAPIGGPNFDHCLFFSDAYILISTFGCFLLPFFVMLFTYGWIFRVVKYQASQIYNNTPTGVALNIRHEFRAAKTLSIIIGIFVLCWFPFFFYICLPWFNLEPPRSLTVHYALDIIRYSNSLINPFIYVGVNRDFRKKSLKLLREWNPSKNDKSWSISMATSSRNITQSSNWTEVDGPIDQHTTTE